MAADKITEVHLIQIWRTNLSWFTTIIRMGKKFFLLLKMNLENVTNLQLAWHLLQGVELHHFYRHLGN